MVQVSNRRTYVSQARRRLSLYVRSYVFIYGGMGVWFKDAPHAVFLVGGSLWFLWVGGKYDLPR